MKYWLHFGCIVSIFSFGLETRAQTLEPVFLQGTVTNQTNPEQPVEATTTVTFDVEGNGVIRIDNPLYGSGACQILSFDEQSQEIVLYSEGPLHHITWTGKVTEAGIIGTYQAEDVAQTSLPDWGVFEFRSGIGDPLVLTDVLSATTIKVEGEEYLLLREGEKALISLHNLDSTYAGQIIALSEDGASAQYLITDQENGRVVTDVNTNEVVLEWIADGKTGYFALNQGEIVQYLDRFYNSLGWSSLTSDDGQIFFFKQVGEHLELYDGNLEPLNTWSGTTEDGRMYWAKREGDVVAYYDQQFNPLNWYSFEAGGQTFYATENSKGKIRYFNSALEEVKQKKKEGFWTKFARGLAIGLQVTGQVLEAYNDQKSTYSSNYDTSSTGNAGYATSTRRANRSRSTRTTSTRIGNTTYSTTAGLGSTYTTTGTRLGNTTFYNTYGSGGSGSVTSQRIGNFEFLSGQSGGSSLSGTIQHLGNFSYTNLHTGSESWSGASQRIGNFTYHNLRSSEGRHLSGSSQKIGNFIYTTVR